MKKTLFVSRYAPPILGGAPQVMYTLMRDLPQESYVMLTSFYAIDNTSAEIGSWLPGKYIFYDNPKATREAAQHGVTKTQRQGRFFIDKLKHAAKQSPLIRDFIGIPVIFVQLFTIVWHGRRAVKEQNIDTIMGFSDYGPAVIGSYILHLITRKPLMLYLFDVYKGNSYPFPGHLLAMLFEKRIVRAASKILTTNDTTTDLYARRYGESVRDKTTTLYNATPAKHAGLELPPYEPKEPYSIVFTGSVYWPQIGALRNLVSAIEGSNIRLTLYSQTPKEILEQNNLLGSNVDFMGSAPTDQMPQIQGAADLLFLPLSWNTRSPLIIETATPGKLTDYLTAGRPMLVHAPKDSAVVQYTKENDCAVVVDDNNPEVLRRELDEFFQDPITIGSRIVENAQALHDKNHDADKNARLFRSLLE